MSDPDPLDDLKKQLEALARRLSDLEGVLPDFLAEAKLLHAENAAILEGLKGEATVGARIGVRLPAQEGDRIALIPLADVCFITTNPDDTLAVHTVDGRNYTNFESLAVIATRFASDPRLMSTHKSFLVNLNHVRTVANDSGGRRLTFTGYPDDVIAKVSADNRAEFESRLSIEHA